MRKSFSITNESSTETLIQSFSSLPEGWHYGSGQGTTKEATNLALDICKLLMKYNANELGAFPDVEGGILVTGYNNDHTIEIFCKPDRLLDLLHETDDSVISEFSDLKYSEIEDYLKKLKWKQRDSFDLGLMNDFEVNPNFFMVSGLNASETVQFYSEPNFIKDVLNEIDNDITGLPMDTQLIKDLKRLEWEIRESFGLYTLCTSTESEEDLEVSHLETLQKVEVVESQFLRKNAQKKVVEQSAPTSNSTIVTIADRDTNQQFSGRSRSRVFQATLC